MNFKLFVFAITMMPSIAYAMENWHPTIYTKERDQLSNDFFTAKPQDLSYLRLKGVVEEHNVHTIVDLGTKIDFNKKNRTLENWIKRVQAGKSPLFGNTPLFEYHYNQKKLTLTGTIETISFTQIESLHNRSWLYVSDVKKYYLDKKTYVKMGAFLRIIDDIARMKEQVVFASSSTTPCALGINKTDLLRGYYKESTSDVPMADPISGYFYIPKPDTNHSQKNMLPRVIKRIPK